MDGGGGACSAALEHAAVVVRRGTIDIEVTGPVTPLFAMSAAPDCLPSLRAATDPEAATTTARTDPGDPRLPGEGGAVARGAVEQDAERLWATSQERTGVRYEVARLAS